MGGLSLTMSTGIGAPIPGPYLLASVAAVVLGGSVLAMGLAAGSQGYAGSASCVPGAGACEFCVAAALSDYGSAGTADRCAYGRFTSVNQVFVYHHGGSVPQCAGMKHDADGGGANMGPVGVTCGDATAVATQRDGNTAGYATIINHDSTGHVHFDGLADY